MTDNEIMKALECCANCESCDFETTNCPLVEEMECRSLLAQKALDLITRQQAEIERLQKEVNLVSIQFQDLQEETDEIKSKAYKEFAKLLRRQSFDRLYVSVDEINNLLKEMAGEDNAKEKE